MEMAKALDFRWDVAAIGTAALVIFVVFLLKIFANSTQVRVPKGSSGWPVIGETLLLLRSDPLSFVGPRVSRYGRVFKTHLLGSPTIVVTDPDLARYIMQDHQNQFQGTLPPISNFTSLVPFSLLTMQGESHDTVHKALMSALNVEVLKAKLGQVDDIARHWVSSFVGKTVLMIDEGHTYALQVIMTLLLDLSPEDPDAKSFQYWFVPFSKALMSMPINLPGTTLNKSTKGYRIPKGWKVLISMPHIHTNPEYYSNPLSFDPTRFQKPPNRNVYLPFGTGNRYCAGSELAKLEIALFVHHLTSHSWARVGKDQGITHWPFPTPKDKLPIRVD